MNLQGLIALFLDYCHSKQLRTKTMISYEQTLKLFARWLMEEHQIDHAEAIREIHIRAYVVDLQKRGKYTFCRDDRMSEINHPTSRRDYRKPISNITINNYLRNLRVFFTRLVESDCITKSPMRKVRSIPQERPAKEYLEDREVIALMRSMDMAYFSEYRDYMVQVSAAPVRFSIGDRPCTASDFPVQRKCLRCRPGMSAFRLFGGTFHPAVS